MGLYVVYRTPKESKDRSVLPQRLQALGCIKVHTAFWKIGGRNVPKVLKVLQKNQPILVQRGRELKKPLVRNNGIAELGSLVVVMYRIPKDVNREQIKRILRRAPCLRLRRSVYAFFQRHSRYDKDNRLVDAHRFVEFLEKINVPVQVISRVTVQDHSAIERLVHEIEERVDRESTDIVRCCKGLIEKILRGDDIPKIKASLSQYKRRLTHLKQVAAFYAKWFQTDYLHSLMKAYRAIKKADAVLNTRGAKHPSISLTRMKRRARI